MKFPANLSSRLCVFCKCREAKFTFRGRVKRDKDHNLCHRCYRSLRDSNCSQRLAAAKPRLFDLAASVFFRQLLEQPWRKHKTLAAVRGR